MLEFDSEKSPIEDFEYPDEDLSDDDLSDEWGESEWVVCPNCGAEVYEDAVRCPICESYITWGSNLWSGQSWWWVILGLLGIAATCMAIAI